MDESDPKKDKPDPVKDELDENIDEPAANIIGPSQNNDGSGDESDPDDEIIICNDQGFPLGDDDQRTQHPIQILEFQAEAVLSPDQAARIFVDFGIPFNLAGRPSVVLELPVFQAVLLNFLLELTPDQRTAIFGGFGPIDDQSSRFHEFGLILTQALAIRNEMVLREHSEGVPALGEIVNDFTIMQTSGGPRGPKPPAEPSNSTSKRTVMVCIVVAAGIVIGAHKIKKKFFDKK